MLFDNIDIVLVGTLNSGNIGSVARAVRNMGLSQLKLVNPKCMIDDQAYRMATHSAEILNTAATYTTISDAIKDAAYVFGTTARKRRLRKYIYPEQMAEKIADLAGSNKISVVFGPEDMGLSNDELELCHEVVSIPTVDDADSVNISHAVMIICYEIFRALQVGHETGSKTVLAPGGKVEEMYDHMKSALLEIGFLKNQKPDQVMGYFRRILTRAGLSRQDVRFIRGIFRQLLWYIRKTNTLKSQ